MPLTSPLAFHRPDRLRKEGSAMRRPSSNPASNRLNDDKVTVGIAAHVTAILVEVSWRKPIPFLTTRVGENLIEVHLLSRWHGSCIFSFALSGAKE
jgi:hypothetical protein